MGRERGRRFGMVHDLPGFDAADAAGGKGSRGHREMGETAASQGRVVQTREEASVRPAFHFGDHITAHTPRRADILVRSPV